jgi:nucleoid-associated protein YgaU
MSRRESFVKLHAKYRHITPVFVGLVLLLVMAGCGNPFAGDEEATPEAGAAPDATFTPAAPMPVVTPTPVDPTVVAEATQNAPPEERPETYVVAENDTLYAIAARFNVDIAVLVEVNGLSNPNDIWVGQELTIPPE